MKQKHFNKPFNFFTNIILAGLLIFGAVACSDDDDNPVTPPVAETQTFKLTIENVTVAKSFFGSGVFNTPVGATSPGPLTPGNSYEFMFNAGPGHKLSFATMFVQSNDLFYAPMADGINLYNNGTALTGDITSQIMLWDAGTEVNEEPGVGANQAPRQSGPNTGVDENGTVRLISAVNDGFTYPAVDATIRVTLTNTNGTEFTLKIENLAASTSPLAPGAFVIHTDANPLFTSGQADAGLGLEAIAEDGNPAGLSMHLNNNSGLVGPIAPGVIALHASGVKSLFTNNTQDGGLGLEGLAEDGNPANLIAALMSNTNITLSEVFNTPVGSASPAPVFPGGMYEITFTATKGDYLSFATMLVQSNDLFYAPSDAGIALWNGSNPISGDITSQIMLWDAGTEVNEFPGAGLNQAPRQSGPNTGTTENGQIKEISNVNDGFTYPPISDVVKISISLQ